MARDYRHGHGHKKGFQRKSQQSKSTSSGRTIWLVWAGGFFVSGVLLAGFFIAQHFINEGVKSDEPTEQSIFKSAEMLTQKTAETIELVSQKLQPEATPPVVVKVESGVMQPGGVAEEEPVKSRYSFYQGLGQSEVIVDVEPLSVQLKTPYYIQAGSFGSEKLAQQEKKRLARLGQTLEVSALHKNNRTYYRLRVGPFKDRLVLNKRRNELIRLGLGTLLIKAPKQTP